MREIELSEKYLAEIAGWKVMKEARSMLAQDRVLEGNWSPPILKGMVKTEGGSLRAGLMFRSRFDVENLCLCPPSKNWGTICAHSIGVGLRVLERRISKRRKSQKEADVNQKSSQLSNTCEPQFHLVKSGEKASMKLWIIFPPNWKQAIERGKISLFFEAETLSKRCPLNMIPISKAPSLLPEDAALWSELKAIAKGNLPAMIILDLPAFSQWITLLQGHPRLTIAKKNPLTISNQAWIPNMIAMLNEDGSLRLKVKKPTFDLTLIFGQMPFIARENDIQPLGLPAKCAAAMQGEMILKRTEVPDFLQSCGDLLFGKTRCQDHSEINSEINSQDHSQGNSHIDIQTNFSLDDFEFAVSEPKFDLSLIGGLAQLHAQLRCFYGERTFILKTISKEKSAWMPDEKSKTRYEMRDLSRENQALDHLLQCGFFQSSKGDCLELRGQDAVLNFFANDYLSLIRKWKIHLDERLKISIEKNIERVRPRFELRSSGIDWIDLKIDYASDSGTRFSEAEIQQCLLSGRNHKRIRNGKIMILEGESLNEFREVLRDCSPIQRKGSYQIQARQAFFLESSISDLGWKLHGKGNHHPQIESSEKTIAPLNLGRLEEILRSYQRQGVAWMNLLRHSNFGGILADEMGLGKTLQVLALLEGLRFSTQKNKGQSLLALVICPSSLVFNWLSEARRFVPDLSTIGIQGTGRESLFSQLEKHTLIITSYALIRRDLKRYEDHEFDLIVLDEAQHIKNRSTQNARAVKSLKGKHRFVLTGTPMENSILDLWSIFDFLMPNYLGSAADFRERYEVPINSEKSQVVFERLRRRLRPFILRRTKKEVEPDLPEKIEQTILCPLSKEQGQIYEKVMIMSRSEIFNASDSNFDSTKKAGQQRMMILKALTRLRQICCDLRLLNFQNNVKEPSGKLAMFHEILNEVLDGDHRVIVFSQFVSMLKLIRQELDEEGIGYCYLDGGTRDRGAEVERFQKGKLPVFLISLRAGGVGLNLTGADIVMHFDPWWNPAIEDQATDRAHRIGQSRVVTSYKLIAKDTIEEKILQLQNRKREMIKGAFGSEDQFAKSLSLDDLCQLLSD